VAPAAALQSGNANEHGDVGESSGKSSLFLLTIGQPRNRIIRRSGYTIGKAFCSLWNVLFFKKFGILSTTLENPWEIINSCGATRGF